LYFSSELDPDILFSTKIFTAALISTHERNATSSTNKCLKYSFLGQYEKTWHSCKMLMLGKNMKIS